jgi:energy-coupling factor transporter ATP-binding protein EcfA2
MNIRDSIVAVLNGNGKVIGTGFLASETLILTCAHVVMAADAIDGDTVQVRFDGRTEKLNALVVPEYWRDVDKGDVAVLRLENVPDGVSPLPLGNAAGSAGHDFYAYGYATVTDVQGIGARGKIVGIVDNGRLVQLSSQEPDHGMSGGPVLDEQRRVVIGMVTKGKGLLEKEQNSRNIQTTFATSVEVIREVSPNLWLTEICPYRSLDVFNEEDAPFFFGREKVVQKLIDSLKREPRFLAVMGPSGSGKSSVVRAGLIPALRQGKVPGSQKWEIVIIRPANDPFEQLAGVGFINPQGGLESAVKTWLADRQDKTRLVLFIDQFEEVLVSAPKDIRQKFIAELAQLLDAPLAITVVLSLRDDFYSRFLHDATVLAEWLERGLVNIPPVLEQDELEAMIVEPAKSVGLTFDEGLVDVIITDACETDRSKGLARSTILPLLEFTLTRLWELRRNGRLTHENYRNIGGLSGSIAQSADFAYYTFDSREQEISRRIFLSLIRFGDEARGIPTTRSKRSLDDIAIDDNSRKLVNMLANFRLITLERTPSGQITLEIAHEALLQNWAILRNWLDQDVIFLNWRENFNSRFMFWENTGHDRSALLSGTFLKQSSYWLKERSNDLRPNEIGFIRLSADLTNRQLLSQIARGVLTVATIILVIIESVLVQNLRRQQSSVNLVPVITLLPTRPISIPSVIIAPTPASTNFAAVTLTSAPSTLTPIATDSFPFETIVHENIKDTGSRIVSSLLSILSIYATSILALLFLASKRGSVIFSRSFLASLIAKPLMIVPQLFGWLLFIGYPERLLMQKDVTNAGHNKFFGIPIRNQNTNKVLISRSGSELISCVSESLGPQCPIIVTGVGGAGKTTLLARFAFLAIKNELPDSLKGYKPIFIRPAFYEKDFLDAIAATLRERDKVAVDSAIVQSQLEAGKYLVLFDAVSEVKVSSQGALEEIIKVATNADYQNCRFIISTRPILDLPNDVIVFDLEPLTPDLVNNLLPQYLTDRESIEFAKKQIQYFGKKPIVPLLLYMILSQSEISGISRTRASLFEQYFRQLLAIKSQLNWDGWNFILGLITSWSMLDTGERGSGFDHELLIEKMSTWKEKGYTLISKSETFYGLKFASEREILEKLQSAGIVRKEWIYWYFAHDAFEEFFAAIQLISIQIRKDWPDLPMWHLTHEQEKSFLGVMEFVHEILLDMGIEGEKIRKKILAKEVSELWKNQLKQK